MYTLFVKYFKIVTFQNENFSEVGLSTVVKAYDYDCGRQCQRDSDYEIVRHFRSFHAGRLYWHITNIITLLQCMCVCVLSFVVYTEQKAYANKCTCALCTFILFVFLYKFWNGFSSMSRLATQFCGREEKKPSALFKLSRKSLRIFYPWNALTIGHWSNIYSKHAFVAMIQVQFIVCVNQNRSVLLIYTYIMCICVSQGVLSGHAMDLYNITGRKTEQQ